MDAQAARADRRPIAVTVGELRTEHSVDAVVVEFIAGMAHAVPFGMRCQPRRRAQEPTPILV